MEIKEFDYRLHKNSKIILYGTNELAYITAKYLESLKIPVYCYANRNGDYHALYKNVLSAERLLELCEKEEVIILFTVINVARSEAEYLSKKGITKIYSARKLWKAIEFKDLGLNDSYKEFFDGIDQYIFMEDTIANPQRLYLYSLDAVVTERCSLKCRDCANLMQYYCHPQNMDVHEIKKSIDKLLDKVYCIFELRILGGEPMMNMEFIKLVDWYKNEGKIQRIVIVSNATIFPNDSILEHLKNEKVIMRMSDYGKLSYKLSEWIQWCTENNIKYEITKIDKWQDCGKLERHDYCEQKLAGIYASCVCRNLPTVIGGYLYNCPYAANAANLGAMRSDEINRDRLLLDDNICTEEIDKFLYERKYLEACRYCNGRNGQNLIVPNIQTNKPLEFTKLINEPIVSNACIEKNVSGEEHLVSIVIPAFNMEKYIVRCLKSILSSSYRKFEILVVDDGSEDNTVSLCREIAERDPFGRVRIIENEHAGVVKTRNTGILSAKGEYITFVDADDYIDGESLSSMVKAMEGCDMVCSDYIISYGDNMMISDTLMDRGQSKFKYPVLPLSPGVYEGERLNLVIRSNFRNFFNKQDDFFAYTWNHLFKADMLKKVCERVDPSIWIMEDIVLLEIYTNYCHKVRMIENVGYYYCCRENKTRYPWDRILSNLEAMYNCLHREFQKQPNADILENYLKDQYQQLILFHMGDAMECSQMIRRIYYPYYGRLKGKRVVLYGAGNVGKAYYMHIKEDKECFLVAWIDKSAEKIRQTEYLPIDSLERLYSEEYDYVIIAVFDEVVYEEIRAELIASGIKAEVIIWNPTKYEK